MTRRERMHRALDAALDFSSDKLAKLKAHELSARKIGSIKEADAFLAKIRQQEPGYVSRESTSLTTNKPKSAAPWTVKVQVSTYRGCKIQYTPPFAFTGYTARGEAVRSKMGDTWSVITPEGRRFIQPSKQACVTYIDDYLDGD